MPIALPDHRHPLIRPGLRRLFNLGPLQRWASAIGALLLPLAAAAWEPTQPVEIVVPAGTGGGADQMARFVQEMVTKHKLMSQPMKVVNKAGNSGAEGLLDVKADKGNPHKLVITLSNLFTVPLATGVPFGWRDITPLSMMALDQFVLWVNADTPYKTAQDLLAAMKAKGPNGFKLGGTGSKQEDQLISVLLETAAGTRIQYVPLKGGGDVAKSLAAGEVDLTVNNPIEAEGLWRSGKLRPLCVFDGGPLGYTAKLSNGQSWNDIPTCMSAGIPAQYLMLRGFFMTPQATPDQVAYYVQLLAKVRELPEWRDFMAKGAFRQTALSGAQYVEWLDRAESYHRVLMREAKLMAK
ncbi:Bug family tripartite tricarboxylate transporter substrate binding protein [Aquabacterium sp.]|uniref:Bug family tripartite tricarboxylate transporter substrate binding protein n=1 Tax=Aquabacterium sp. TaxID=1872578 RepID=UPI00378500EB